MKVKVLIENKSREGLVAEHGLSLFIEHNGTRILLDAGQTSAFMENAAVMGADIENADYCVLSHGHYDHSGGFAAYLKTNEDKKIYAMSSAAEAYYSGSGGKIHEIGIPKDVYPAHKNNFRFVDVATEISDGVYVIPHTTPGLEKIGERAKLYKMTDGDYVADDFAHELSLVIDTESGLVIFNSCSHSGIVNILEEVKTYFGNKEIYGFFGGLHMKGIKDNVEICTFSEEEVANMAAGIKRYGLKKLFTGHCTGVAGYEMIKEHLGENAVYMMTGMEFHI